MNPEQDYPFTQAELEDMAQYRKQQEEIFRQAWLDYQGYVSEEEELPE